MPIKVGGLIFQSPYLGGSNVQAVLEMKDINKTFVKVHALKDVDFRVQSGETMGLVGENGAGKSTLMKVLTGAYAKDSGQIIVDGTEVPRMTTAIAQKLGIEQVYQTPELAGDMTVAENICLGHSSMSNKGLVSWRKMYQDVNDFLQKYGIPIRAEQKVGTLSTALRQFVAISKVIYRDPKIIIFDEPTAVLSDSEVKLLFSIIDTLKKQGKTIIYISHRLEEVFQLCDRISIMRDGSMVNMLENKNLTKEVLISNMLGKHLGAMYPEKGHRKSDDVVLELKNVTTSKITDISFRLYEGEILGIVGLVGSGRTETARAIFGSDRIHEGTILVNGKEVKIHSPVDAVKQGIFLAPEDRKGEAMVLCRSIRENVTLSKLKSIAPHGICHERDEFQKVNELCSGLNVKMSSIESLVQDLSGGNQQKVVIAKAFTADPEILIFDEPTQGIDVGAKAEIYILLEKLRSEGKSIILISSEIEEIQGTCDRTIILRDGRVAGEIQGEDLDNSEMVLQYMYREVNKS